MGNTISEQSIVTAISDQVSGDLLAEETVILNMKDGVYFGLDPIGAHIWKLIQEPISVRDVKNILLEEYDVEAAQCIIEVLALLEDMAAKGLIEVSDGPPA